MVSGEGEHPTGQPGTGAEQAGPPPPPPQKGTNWAAILIVVAALVLLGGMAMVIVGVSAIARGSGAPFGGLGEHVGVVTVSGAIMSEGEQTILGQRLGGARQTMEQLRRAGRDESIKAVVLRINSPGGSAAASQAIYQEVKRLMEEKPVVASMADVAASGGYYIAAPANRIVANASTVTGSIGVRMMYLQYHELAGEVGIEGGNLTTGPYKDTGSPWREMREDERELLEGVLDDMYEQFVGHVAEGRGMEAAEVRKLADGRIYTGEQALEVGLIDEMGNFYDAVKVAGELGGIEGEPKIKEMTGGRSLLELMGGMERLRLQTLVERMLYDERLSGVQDMMRMMPGIEGR